MPLLNAVGIGFDEMREATDGISSISVDSLQNLCELVATRRRDRGQRGCDWKGARNSSGVQRWQKERAREDLVVPWKAATY